MMFSVLELLARIGRWLLAVVYSRTRVAFCCFFTMG